jgi:FSR family fosmidomycin resistance protein-like MFS transporter
MFHPPAAGMVQTYSGGSHSFSMSIFNLGGTMAFGIGPLFVTWYVSRFGLPLLPYTCVLGLASVVFLFFIVPMPETEGLRSLGLIGSIKDVFADVWKPIFILWLLSVLRAFVSQSIMTFAPILFYTRDGLPLVSVGGIVAAYVIAGAVSGLVSGHLADRIGYKPIYYVTFALTTPFLYFFLHSSGNWMYINAFLAGFMALATLPLAVSMAQELAPRGRSMVSSLMMGLAFGLGAVLAPITGKLADMFSIQPVLTGMVWLPLLALPLIYYLPDKTRAAT